MYNNQRIIKELTPYIPAVEIFRIYEREPGAAFLDSSLVNELGHYSVIGRCPYLKLVKDGKTFTINGKPETETTFEDYMREYLNTHEDKNDSRLPLVSGAVGYFSYDYGRKQMGVPSGEKDLVTIPEAVLMFCCGRLSGKKDVSCVKWNQRKCRGADRRNGKSNPGICRGWQTGRTGNRRKKEIRKWDDHGKFSP